MRIFRSSLRSGIPFRCKEEEPVYPKEDFAKTYPLLGIENAGIDGEFGKNGSIAFFKGNIYGTLLLADARTNEPFKQKVQVEDVIELLEDDLDEDGIGYIFPGNVIETRDLIFSVLRSETPIKPLMPGSKLPSSGKGYSVTLEGEETVNKPSPFDKLLDLDL